MLERRMMMDDSMVDRAICLLDNIYYLRDACYMAINVWSPSFTIISTALSTDTNFACLLPGSLGLCLLLVLLLCLGRVK